MSHCKRELRGTCMSALAPQELCRGQAQPRWPPGVQSRHFSVLYPPVTQTSWLCHHSVRDSEAKPTLLLCIFEGCPDSAMQSCQRHKSQNSLDHFRVQRCDSFAQRDSFAYLGTYQKADPSNVNRFLSSPFSNRILTVSPSLLVCHTLPSLSHPTAHPYPRTPHSPRKAQVRWPLLSTVSSTPFSPHVVWTYWFSNLAFSRFYHNSHILQDLKHFGGRNLDKAIGWMDENYR